MHELRIEEFPRRHTVGFVISVALQMDVLGNIPSKPSCIWIFQISYSPTQNWGRWLFVDYSPVETTVTH